MVASSITLLTALLLLSVLFVIVLGSPESNVVEPGGSYAFLFIFGATISHSYYPRFLHLQRILRIQWKTLRHSSS